MASELDPISYLEAEHVVQLRHQASTFREVQRRKLTSRGVLQVESLGVSGARTHEWLLACSVLSSIYSFVDLVALSQWLKGLAPGCFCCRVEFPSQLPASVHQYLGRNTLRRHPAQVKGIHLFRGSREGYTASSHPAVEAVGLVVRFPAMTQTDHLHAMSSERACGSKR